MRIIKYDNFIGEELIENGLCGIYCIENTINGKKYIGQSINIKTRINRHKKDAYNNSEWNKTYNYPLYRAIRKHGIENFKSYVLKLCKKENLNGFENYYIEYLKRYITENGYNIIKTVNGVRVGGVKFNLNDINNIKRDLKDIKMLKSEIKVKYNISDGFISEINNGKRYFDDNETYPLRKIKDDELNFKIYGNIRNMKKYNYKSCKNCKSNFSPRWSDNFCSKECYYKFRDKFIPSKNELIKLLEECPNFTRLGKKYGVSGNAVKKWCVLRGIPAKSTYWTDLYLEVKGYTYIMYLKYLEFKDKDETMFKFVIENYEVLGEKVLVYDNKVITQGLYDTIGIIHKFK